MEQKKEFEFEEIFWIGTIAQKPAIRIDSIGKDLVILSQQVNGEKRAVFIDAKFLPLLTKELLNFQMKNNGSN
jgi:hypothetical protein